jgi:hypothetical protein
MQQYAKMVSICEQTIHDKIGSLGGLSFSSEGMNEEVTQDAFYCRYYCEKMVNNAICSHMFLMVECFSALWISQEVEKMGH